jgi:hypothetical protein
VLRLKAISTASVFSRSIQKFDLSFLLGDKEHLQSDVLETISERKGRPGEMLDLIGAVPEQLAFRI